jgi:preprotein translocase SecE subunit
MWQYFKDVRSELRHVAWPTRAQTVTYTVVVVGVSLAAAVYLGILDFAFVEGIRKLI